MSYILDAIMKSDQQRQHGTTPTLSTAHGIAAAPKQPPFLSYSLLAALLVAAGIAIGWLRPWQTAPQTPAASADKIAPDAQSGQVPGTAPVTANKDVPAFVAAGTREASAPFVAGVAKDTAMVTPKAIAKTPTGSAQGNTTAVMTLAELPVPIQQDIPRMSISVHAYSGAPANRLVSINDQLLREGDTLAPGIRLDEITADGMIFSYKGYRFRTTARGSGPLR